MHDTTQHCATVDRSIVSVLGNSSTRDPGGYKRYLIGKRTRVLRSEAVPSWRPNLRSVNLIGSTCVGLMHVLARAEKQGELSPGADLVSIADFLREGNVAMAHMKMHPLGRGFLASIIS
jgi:hypothetical protein